MSIFGNLNRVIILSSVAIFITLKVIGDVIFHTLGLIDNPIISFWKIISSIVIIASFIFYFFSLTTDKSLEDNKNYSENFLAEYLRIFFMLLFVGFMMTILPSKQSEILGNNKFIVFLASELGIILSLLVSSYIIWFMFKWLDIRKHKQTSMFMKIIGIGLTYLFFVEIVSNISSILKHTDTMNTIFYVLLGLVVFAISKKNAWIAQLPRSRKTRIFWLSLAITVVAFVISANSMESDNSYGQLILSYLPGGHYLFSASMMFLAFYSLRIFFAVVASFPTTSIVERKTSEITTLTYLNRFITESASKDISYLLDTVTQLAIHACGGSSVWIEVYGDEEKIKIGSVVNINPDALNTFHQNQKIGTIFTTINSPLLIESIPETKEIAPLKAFLPNANTLIAIPLFQGKKRFGTLIALDSEEYGFEYDDINILAAFGDNVNLALENSRLLKDSIEKERYLSEMLIAKRIQKELLPHTLPNLNKFSISAFTMPAEEVGGDYYDVAQFSDGTPCVLIGDVSGKGMSAAFYMAQLKGVVQSLAEQCNSPKDLLSKINRTLFGLMDKQSYVTMLCVKIDDKSSKLTFARAGHPPIFIKLGTKVAIVTPKGLGIGLAKSDTFDKFIEETTFELNAGDACLLITDGISELRNKQGEELGFEELQKAMESYSGDAEGLIAKIIDVADEHKNGIIAHDDITIVAISNSK